MSRVIGIDPGASGAMALIVDGHLQDVIDMPTKPGGVTSGRGIVNYLRAWDPDVVFLEDVHCNGRNGSKANWSLGHSMGVIEGVIESMRHPLVRMSPQEWKKLSGLIGKDKDVSRQLAQELWPHLYDKFKFKKNADRAEAALIGRAGVMKTVRESHEEWTAI